MHREYFQTKLTPVIFIRFRHLVHTIWKPAVA